MSPGWARHTVVLDTPPAPKEVTVKRLLLAFMLTLLLVPAAASAMRPVEDTPFRYDNVQATTPAVVHEVRTVTKSPDNTLPIALAAAALGLTIAGFGYVALRMRPMPRSS
jgi:hypothetical protein